MLLLFVYAILCLGSRAYGDSSRSSTKLPVIVNTWPFKNASQAAWDELSKPGSSAMDALVAGGSNAEADRTIGSIGYGGSPDEHGETTLDAMVMDGNTMDVGSVGCLRRVKDAIAAARAVMEYTTHTLLVGELATEFAQGMGLTVSDLHSNSSIEVQKQWLKSNCQPNCRMNVTPDHTKSCGPYKPDKMGFKATDFGDLSSRYNEYISEKNHDTIGMAIVDSKGHVVSGTTTNGVNHKVPGRVGDSPIVGAGSYADSTVGAAAATGDGDVMMRFLPSFYAVEMMRDGHSPNKSCSMAAARIVKYYPGSTGALICVTKDGEHGAGCFGLKTFTYTVINEAVKTPTLFTVPCVKKS